MALGLARSAPSGRIAIARAGGILAPELLPPALEREAAAARAAACTPLRPRVVERVLREAWGRPVGTVLEVLEPEPLAVTPAAQVHRGALDGAEVTVKVRRPGVERTVRNDVALLEALAPPLAAAFPRVDAAAVLRDVRALVLDELDLEHEASQQRRLARALRDVAGVRVPRPHLELCAETVLVADFVPGTTLADGASPPDPDAAARALVAAFRVAVLGAGLAPYDPRPSHVVVGEDGNLALLGMGVARAVDRPRARRALDALVAAGEDEAPAFTAAVREVVPGGVAVEAFTTARAVLGELLAGPATLDAAALRALVERADACAGELVGVAAAASVLPEDLSLGRMLGQLVAVLARLGPTEDWVALARGSR